VGRRKRYINCLSSAEIFIHDKFMGKSDYTRGEVAEMLVLWANTVVTMHKRSKQRKKRPRVVSEPKTANPTGAILTNKRRKQ
jgi:hypothetical protein